MLYLGKQLFPAAPRRLGRRSGLTLALMVLALGLGRSPDLSPSDSVVAFLMASFWLGIIALPVMAIMGPLTRQLLRIVRIERPW